MSGKLNVHHVIHIDYAQKGNYPYCPHYYHYDSMQYSPYYDYMSMKRQSSSYWPQIQDEFYNSFPYENNGYEWERMWPYYNYNFSYGQPYEKENFKTNDFSRFDKHKLDGIKKEEKKNEKNEKVPENKAPDSEVPAKKETFLGLLKKNINLSAKKED